MIKNGLHHTVHAHVERWRESAHGTHQRAYYTVQAGLCCDQHRQLAEENMLQSDQQ